MNDQAVAKPSVDRDQRSLNHFSALNWRSREGEWRLTGLVNSLNTELISESLAKSIFGEHAVLDEVLVIVILDNGLLSADGLASICQTKSFFSLLLFESIGSIFSLVFGEVTFDILILFPLSDKVGFFSGIFGGLSGGSISLGSSLSLVSLLLLFSTLFLSLVRDNSPGASDFIHHFENVSEKWSASDFGWSRPRE